MIHNEWIWNIIFYFFSFFFTSHCFSSLVDDSLFFHIFSSSFSFCYGASPYVRELMNFYVYDARHIKDIVMYVLVFIFILRYVFYILYLPV